MLPGFRNLGSVSLVELDSFSSMKEFLKKKKNGFGKKKKKKKKNTQGSSCR